MPAPTQPSIESYLTQALLKEGFVNKYYENGTYKQDPTQLPEELKSLVKALSTGLSLQWQAWQSTQTVVANDLSTGAPVLGVAPTALP